MNTATPCRVRITTCLILVCIICQMLPIHAESSAPATYVALGDSITEGTGMNSAEDTFVAQFTSLLAQSHPDIQSYNLGHKGDCVADTLAVVNKADTQALLADADFVTLTSGGNDVLGLAAAAAQSLTGKNYKKVSKIPAIVKNETIAKSLLKYLNDESVQKQLDEFLTSFANEYDTLLKQLRAASPNSIILVQTVYNPASGSSYAALSECIDTVLLRLNSIIRETVAEQTDDNIILVDIEKTFAEQAETYVRIMEDDIHPTEEGHTAIAQALLNALVSKESSTAASADAVTSATADDSAPVLSNNTTATNSENGRIRFLTWSGGAFLAGIAVFLLTRVVRAHR